MVNLAATVAVAMAVVYFQKWRIELPVRDEGCGIVHVFCSVLHLPFFVEQPSHLYWAYASVLGRCFFFLLKVKRKRANEKFLA